MTEKKERYLLDEFIVSKFLNVDIEHPSVENFFKKVREMLNLLIPNFLVDYTSLRDVNFDDAFSAYKEYLRLSGSDILEEDGTETLNDEVYKILNDEYFHNGLEERINEYFGKIYNQYVPNLDDSTKIEVDEYIKSKNEEKQKELDQIIGQIDDALEEVDKAEAMLEAKLERMRKLGGTRN